MSKALENIGGEFEIELPQKEKLDDYLDLILPQIRQWSEDLREMENYVISGGKPWLEVRDDPGFQETVLHFFNEGGEYLQSVDGNVSRGRWRLLDATNKIIIEQGGGGKAGSPNKSELFELAFLNQKFFILKKHGDQFKKRSRRYLMLGFEGSIRGLKWKDCVELLFNEYRSHWGMFNYIVVAAIILILIVIIFSVL
jgi:hypothetical protein